jgi:hypothetical protein
MQEEQKIIAPTEVKELKSETKVSAVHVKWNKKHYHVCKAFIGRIGWVISGFNATNRGARANNDSIFTFRGEDLQAGIDHLVKILNGLEEPKKESYR